MFINTEQFSSRKPKKVVFNKKTKNKQFSTKKTKNKYSCTQEMGESYKLEKFQRRNPHKPRIQLIKGETLSSEIKLLIVQQKCDEPHSLKTSSEKV